ncbi:MAG: type IX secretion system sortase PorU [Balneolales bacterium]|nr:type IX secretion system sortase PorU [Balneolales bacterium]
MNTNLNTFRAALLLLLLLLSFPATTYAQSFKVHQQTATFTDYVFSNDSLNVRAPQYLQVPYISGERRYRILEQEVVPVRNPRIRSDVPEARQHLSALLATSEEPLVVASPVREYRKQLKSTLQVNVARISSRDNNSYLVARHLVIRVYNETSWSPSAIQAAENMSQRLSSEGMQHPLSTGNWYRIPITRNGIYRLDRAYLESLGINAGSIDPRNIQIWGTSGYQLPYENAASRPSFEQIPIIVEGESNGSFGSSDAVFFYANDVNERIFDPANRSWSHKLHSYSKINYVYITVGPERGLRLTNFTPQGTVSETITQFRDFLWLEEDLFMPESQQRSGTTWFGKLFTPEFSSDVIFRDTLAGYIQGTPIEFTARMAGRSRTAMTFDFFQNNNSFGSINIAAISDLQGATGRNSNFGNIIRILNNPTLQNNDVFEIRADFSTTSLESRGWVDYINVRATRTLSPVNGRLQFLSPDDAPLSGNQVAEYRFSGFTQRPLVMDVTNPASPVLLPANGNGNNWSVNYYKRAGQKMIAQTNFYRPAAGEAVINQNLHGINFYPNYIIVTSASLLEEAERLADYRTNRNGFRTVVVTQEQIFHEFSGGVPDPTAIRDFLKYLYDYAGLNEELLPEYLVMFGNATFDYKGIEQSPMQNLVFNFQHYVDQDNLSRAGTYGSDDFFGFLGDDEGSWRSSDLNNRLDLKIGRLPVQTLNEARIMVDKIITFENRDQDGDWRTLFTFTADDNDNGGGNERDLHTFNADFTADTIDQDASGIRLRKLYQFRYPIENTPAGQRVPQGTSAIIQQINSGTLTFHFSGHGSEQQLTRQRLFQSSDIPRLTNRERPTILVTATCSFGRYDDNIDFSGAEKLMLHDNGGAVAAFTTSRVVFTSPNPSLDNDNNFSLHIELTNQMVQRNPDGSGRSIGEIFKRTKNSILATNETRNTFSVNNRKFILLGDPAMSFGLPEQQMTISSINGQTDFEGGPIQIRSLDRVNINGFVQSPNGGIDASFNGEGLLRVYDAARIEELPNPELTCNYLGPECGFRVQNDLLFNGRVSITNGEFSAEFIVPKDIAYSDSLARIHIYATNPDRTDAVGSFSSIRFNGINEEAQNLFDGPELDVYLNDDTFVNGSLVNRNPQLIVDVNSEGGVNTTGAGVGHEIIGILRNTNNPQQEQTFILNDFYTSALDDFTRGRIEYPLDNLPDGSYSLFVRVWDVFNNVGESEIFFDVAGGGNLLIRNVYNYPNPMHNFTRFAFEHNQPAGQPMDVFIRIYTLSGRPVAQIRESRIANGNLEMFEWAGRDDDMNRLAAGTYLYHLRVRTDGPEGRQTEEKIERLVIIR